EMVLARHVARQALRDELKDDVTALPLSCDVALQECSGPVVERILKIQKLANQLRNKFAVSDQSSVATKRGGAAQYWTACSISVSSGALAQHKGENLLRHRRIPNRRKRLPMQRRRSMLTKCGEMLGRAVALI